MKRRLAFLIHDLNPWGGQDQSTLEILKCLDPEFQVDIVSFTLFGKEKWENAKVNRVRPYLKRPVLLKSIIFYGVTLFLFYRWRFFGNRPFIHATGTCSLKSDIVHVQFIHAGWNQVHLRSKDFFFRKIYRKIELGFHLGMEKILFQNNKQYIAISQGVAKDLQTFFKIQPERIHVIHHGVDPDRFCPLPVDLAPVKKEFKQSLSIGLDQKVVLFVGEPERKGLQMAMRSLAACSEAAKKKGVLVAVGVTQTESWISLAYELQIQDQLRLISHTPDVLKYYQMADFFFLPTLYEPFGLVGLEAMSCGLPVVISQCAGVSDLMVHGQSGFLIQDPCSVDEMVEYLETLILNFHRCEAMGRAARQVAVNRPWSEVGRDYLTLLKSISSS